MTKTEYEIVKDTISHLQTVLLQYWGKPDNSGNLDIFRCTDVTITKFYHDATRVWLELHDRMVEEEQQKNGSNA